MLKDYIFIDFDGVILDSQKRIHDRMDTFFTGSDKNGNYNNYLKYADEHIEEWDYIIREAPTLNNSVEIIRELEKLDRKIAILTKFHSLDEANVKIDDLRNHRKINIPVILVPPRAFKEQVIIPNGQLLVDDRETNIEHWVNSGGTGVVFDPTIEKDTTTKVKSLEFLLK